MLALGLTAVKHIYLLNSFAPEDTFARQAGAGTVRLRPALELSPKPTTFGFWPSNRSESVEPL